MINVEEMKEILNTLLEIIDNKPIYHAAERIELVHVVHYKRIMLVVLEVTVCLSWLICLWRFL